MAELAQPGALHVTLDLVRDRTAERDQTIAKELTDRMVDVLGQAGAEKTEGDRVPPDGSPQRTWTAAQVLDPLAARCGKSAERTSDRRKGQRRVREVAQPFAGGGERPGTEADRREGEFSLQLAAEMSF